MKRAMTAGRRHARACAALGALLAVGAGGCREQQSFLVVTVQSIDTTPISGVNDLVVTVTGSGSEAVLTYPAPGQTPYAITGVLDPVTGKIGKTLSVSFTQSRSGDVNIDVAARDAARCTIGHGQADKPIKKGGVDSLTVELAHTSGPCEGVDGGGGDGDAVDGLIFPGCDPAAATCGAGMTCAVDCSSQMGQCVVAGNTAGGGLCQVNADCAPGTQCFAYSGPGCQVKSCLKFCKTDNDCGAGSGSVCQGKVACTIAAATVLTGYHTCTFACDPRGDATTGCPAGLHCFVVDTMDQVDCTCTEATRTKAEGEACVVGSDCRPGLICNKMSGTSFCRKVCKLSENGADCATGQACATLSGDQVYGACI